MSGPALADLVSAGARQQDAVAINDHIFMSRGVSNCYLVGTGSGALLVNSGLPHEAKDHRDRFSRACDERVQVIVFTQSHGDHVGGWTTFNGPGVDTIVQRNFADVRGYWNRLAPFYGRRTAKLWGSVAATRAPGARAGSAPVLPPDPVPTVTFDDTYSFTVNGMRVELLAVPGGETTDSLVVWLPDERVAFSGNMLGPMYLHVPNLYTVRGDKLRSALRYVESVDRLRALEPEVLITGHGDPIRGAKRIHADLTKLRDAVQWVHDQTVAGMNAGTDLFTLMREIKPPPELTVGEGHGKVMWNVRAIWEEYAGWFRYESTTELYAVPPRAVWKDLVELAGGPDALAARAASHVAARRPEEALHLTDVVLHAAPEHREARKTALAAHALLLERGGAANLSENRWLESEIAAARAALGDETGKN
jgi:alkyl sulfatase BDS1-like metallo-beta-lactamase superfamily hydrolase